MPRPTLKPLDPRQWQFYKERNPPFEWYDPDKKPRSPRQLQIDIWETSDRIRRQMGVNDLLYAHYQLIARTVRWQRWMLRTLWGAFIGSLLLIGYCAEHFGPFVVKGMAK